jgi:hypothetical protein
MTLETKLFIAGVFIALLMAGGAWYSIDLLDAGKKEETAAVQKEHDIAQKNANQLTALWASRVQDAQTIHKTELDSLSNITLRVSKYPMPASGAHIPATSDSARTPASGDLCVSVLQESPEQLRSDFAAAQHADTLVADYRELYNAWPISSPPPR